MSECKWGNFPHWWPFWVFGEHCGALVVRRSRLLEFAVTESIMGGWLGATPCDVSPEVADEWYRRGAWA